MVQAVAPTVLVMCGSGLVRMPVAEAGAATEPDLAALARRLAQVEARLAALEARPEEVAHFTAMAAMPAVAAAASFILRLANLKPERPGDVLAKGQPVEVRPSAPLPSGVEMGVPLASADGVVSVPMRATLALTAGTSTLWTVTALR